MVNCVTSHVNLGYSMKNIFIPQRKEHFLQLIHSTRVLTHNLRWRAEFALRKPKTVKKETFGFKSLAHPKPVPEMKEFEEKLFDMVNNIEYKNVSNPFQTKLNTDIRNIQNEPKLLIPADKTTNFYKVDTATAQALQEKDLNKDYIKAGKVVLNKLNKEAKQVTTKLGLQDRVFTTAKQEAFNTLKDHKPNFSNKPTTRLINPTKPQLGRVSKQLLSKIIEIVREKSGLNQWKNTYDFLNFFNNLQDKGSKSFIKFDICNFYPSITEELLRKAIDHAAKYTEISDDEKEILFHTSKSVLYHKGEAWMKKGGSLFDVGMGGFDGAEKCDLVGLFLLSLLKDLPHLIPGLFRDDCLAVTTQTPFEAEKTKKQICKIFKSQGLELTIEANLKVTDFLDVEVNLNTGTHRPYSKPNNTILYVNVNSNHPHSVIKNIPLAVQKRLSLLSSNELIFNEAAPQYQEALEKSGHTHKIVFDKDAKTTKSSKNNRSRQVTWYNPPFSQNVKTNIGAKFLKIIDSSFHKGHVLNKTFNRHTIKISYRTTSNMSQVIMRHNKKIHTISQPAPTIEKECNCQKANLPCIMGGKCKPGNVIYRGSVVRADTGHTDTYTGLTEKSWKLRWGNHKQNFKNPSQQHRTATSLSKHIWSLKDQGIDYSITFKQVDRAPAYNPVTGVCRLCLKEKYYIMFEPDGASINQKSEFYSICMHKFKHLLCDT